MEATLVSGREVTVSWGYDDDGSVVLDADQPQELSDAEKAELIELIAAADAEEDSSADTDTGYVEGGHQMMNIFVMLQGLSMLEANIRRMAADDMTWLWPAVTEDTPAIGTLFFARTRDDQFLLFQAVSSTEALVLSPSSTLYGSVIPFGLLFEGPDFKNFLFDAAMDLAMRQDPEDEEDDEFGDEDDEDDEGEDDFDEDYVPPPPGSKRISK
ncbi:hypothetical protein D3C87_1279750 [compost metagenome]